MDWIIAIVCIPAAYFMTLAVLGVAIQNKTAVLLSIPVMIAILIFAAVTA